MGEKPSLSSSSYSSSSIARTSLMPSSPSSPSAGPIIPYHANHHSLPPSLPPYYIPPYNTSLPLPKFNSSPEYHTTEYRTTTPSPPHTHTYIYIHPIPKPLLLLIIMATSTHPRSAYLLTHLPTLPTHQTTHNNNTTYDSIASYPRHTGQSHRVMAIS